MNGYSTVVPYNCIKIKGDPISATGFLNNKKDKHRAWAKIFKRKTN